MIKKTITDEEISLSLDDVKETLKTVKGLGSTLFVTDQMLDVENVFQVAPDEIDDVNGEFNCVVVNVNKSIMDKKDDIIAYLFLRIIDKVKKGGIIFIPESTFKYTPHGRIGAEALVKVLDLKLELPVHNLKRMVIVSKS